MYASDQTHSSVTRAAWLAGVPRSNVRLLATDGGFRLRMDALREALARDRADGFIPLMVVANAGTTNTGSVDPLHEIATLCEREQVWMHVDAAYGGFAVLTPVGRKMLAGVEYADSVTLDPHKWLFVPFECGCLLARDPQRLKAAFQILPEYLADVQGGHELVNFADYGEQLTRYSRAVKVWLSVRYFGTDAIGDAIDRGMSLARRLEARIRDLPNFEVLSPARFGVVCFRARPDSAGEVAELDALNERILARVVGEGRYFISSTRLRGAFSLRACILGYRTSEEDIDSLARAVANAAREVSSASAAT